MNAIQFKYDKQHRLKIYIKQLRKIENNIQILEYMLDKKSTNLSKSGDEDIESNFLHSELRELQKIKDFTKIQIMRCMSLPKITLNRNVL